MPSVLAGKLTRGEPACTIALVGDERRACAIVCTADRHRSFTMHTCACAATHMDTTISPELLGRGVPFCADVAVDTREQLLVHPLLCATGR